LHILGVKFNEIWSKSTAQRDKVLILIQVDMQYKNCV